MNPALSPRPVVALTPLFPAAVIRQRVHALAEALAPDLAHTEVACVAILNGSFVFAADLARELAEHDVHLVIDFITMEGYGAGTTHSGVARLRQDLSLPVAGQQVLLLDDILDTGLTLQSVTALLRERGAASVRTCVLLDKPARRRVPVTADLVGFTIDDVFVVGYGLDYGNRYRHLPYLAALTFAAGPGEGDPRHAR